MSYPNLPYETNLDRFLWRLAGVLLGLLGLVGVAFLVLLTQTRAGTAIGGLLNLLFAMDTVQAMWYATRAAGLMAYLLLWLSTAWGLAVSSKILDHFLQRAFTYDWHQFISLLAILFTLAHVVVLLADRFMPFSVADILIPFVDPYRPLWVGIGVIGFYLTLLVTITFYLRRWIGTRAFRVIHLASFLAYAGATVHGLMAGTDSALWTTQLMYAGTALVIVFLAAHWLALILLNKLDGLLHSEARRPIGRI